MTDRPDLKILLVEDASFFARIMCGELEKAGFKNVELARNFAEAKTFLETTPTRPFLALVDLTLPDAPNGEVVDLTIEAGLPTIVFSGRFDETTRGTILGKGIVDYILKDSPASLSYLGDLVKRVEKNARTRVLIADGSAAHRTVLKERLERYRLNVTTTSTSDETLKMLDRNEDIQMLILGHTLPDRDGFETLTRIRKRRGLHNLAVIGIAEGPCPELTAKYLKSGANDFMTKSCTPEELILRVSQNLDNIEHIRRLTELANRDPMTGLFNRRYLHENIEKMHDELIQNGEPIRYAMIDIDRFKQINDHFGHATGDLLIKAVANRIIDLLPEGGVAVRIGGDEFCVALPSIDAQTARFFLSELRSSLPVTVPGMDNEVLTSTISVGLSAGREATLSDGLRTADRCLYEAKESGRNRIIAA
ncbi:diguanylate cyclase [Rhodobacteraceae bacterium RKSG542]|uniref:diguanylate cyclase n=1 Tax=Pseudovibrio flavus TaxID=2529854 RepID=UPI0012BC9A98|nr:diguanylate cyclase [Pseudovibrio flavus]MTI17077.1 diguanylate cyclase [Pseudovibrio flavus]